MRSNLLAGLLTVVAVLPAAAQPGTPLFRYLAFSAEDLEIAPGHGMSLHGAIHANGDLYLNSENSLTIGDGPGVPLAPVTAGGRIYRGRKNNTDCRGTVRIDALRDVLEPFGDLDPVTVPCAFGARVLLSPAVIADFEGSVADESPLGPLPPRAVIARGDAYWQIADLRLALDLSRPAASGLHPIVAQDAEGAVDTERTARLQAFMTAKPGRIFYNDVPRADRSAPGNCNPSSTIAVGTYCSRQAYAVPFATDADVYPCVASDLNLYPGCSRYLSTLAYGTDGWRTARRGGFYDNREGEWVYMLSVNAHDLLAWNRAQPPESRLLDPDDASDGGIVLYLTVVGGSPDAVTSPRRAVRVFGSPNLGFPAGVADPTGLTVVSDQAVYVEGHYNVDPSAGGVYDGGYPKQPAALIGDAINVLSANWSGHPDATAFSATRCRNDCQSRKSLGSPAERPATTTYVNAAFLGGTTPTSGSAYGGGYESHARLHESWSGMVFRHRGALVSLGAPLRNPSAWCGIGGGLASGCNVYDPPARDWDFDPTFLDDTLLPPATPALGCGNGVVDEGESCDDGNTASGDCCSSLCRIEIAGSVCRAAASPCDAPEVCDGSSTVCPADALLDDGAACDDGDPCTTGDGCAAGACAPGIGCDDGDACTGDVCTPAGCAHEAAPATTCHAAATATFTLSQKHGVSRSLRWKWMKGSSTLAELGDPPVSTGYALCVYDAAGLVLRGDLPAGSSRWRKAGTTMWRYTDPTASAAGISKLDLAGSDVERARIALTAVGDALADPDLSAGLALPVTVQLRRDDAPSCWTSVFEAASVKRNHASRFDARVR